MRSQDMQRARRPVAPIFALRHFHLSDFKAVASWIAEREVLREFASNRLGWPVNEEEFVALARSNGWMLVAHRPEFPLGHVQLSLDAASTTISCLIVAPNLRGAGLGRVLLELVISRAPE